MISGTGSDTSTTVANLDAFQIVCVVAQDNFYLNGTSDGPTTIAIGSTNADDLELQLKDGYIAEIILYDGTITTDNRQKIEGYLAHRWMFPSRLPTSHPYRGYPPIV